MALAFASNRATCASGPARGSSLRRAAAVGPTRVLRPVVARGYCTGGRSYYGPGPEDGRRAMQELLRDMQRAGGVGVSWGPGGQVRFDLGGMGGAAPGQWRPDTVESEAAAKSGPTYRLPVDLAKEADAYTVTADVPGIQKSELSIRLVKAESQQPATLVIAGARTSPAPGDAAGAAMLRERRGGSFERRVPLPDDAGASGITARVKDGVLTVRVPRVEPPKAQQGSEIPIL